MFIADKHGNTFDTKNTFRSSTSSINRWGEGEFIHKEVRSGSQGLLIKAVVPWNSNISYCGIWCSFHIAEGSSTDHVLSDWLFLRFHVHINAHPRQFPFCLPLQVEYTCVCMCVACLPPLTSIVNVFSVNFFLPFLSLFFHVSEERSLREEKCARSCFDEINEDARKDRPFSPSDIGLACRSRFPISLDADPTIRLLRQG